MPYKKEQFIEDFKNAYNQSQQLHYLYRYLKEYDGQIASVNVEKLEEETDNIAYYKFIFTLDNENVIETDSIAFASYTYVDELDNRVNSINNTITSINNTITSLDRRISNNEGDIVDINDKMLTLPNTAPTTRKVVTIDTNGSQDNVDGTELTILMDNIVDSNGHKRFQEWDINNLSTGLDITYAKVTLSGSHLMAVVSGRNNTENAISLPYEMFSTTLPTWLLLKLYAPNGNNTGVRDVSAPELKVFSSLWYEATSYICIVHIVPSSNSFIIQRSTTISVPANSYIRLQVDLIVD